MSVHPFVLIIISLVTVGLIVFIVTLFVFWRKAHHDEQPEEEVFEYHAENANFLPSLKNETISFSSARAAVRRTALADLADARSDEDGYTAHVRRGADIEVTASEDPLDATDQEKGSAINRQRIEEAISEDSAADQETEAPDIETRLESFNFKQDIVDIVTEIGQNYRNHGISLGRDSEAVDGEFEKAEVDRRAAEESADKRRGGGFSM